jgi:hypothetical protein
MRHVVALAALTLLSSSIASAAPASGREHDVGMVDVSSEPHAANITHTIYMNRCIGGCVVRPGDNDASTNHSSLISQTSNISEFQYSDTIWDAVVACIENTYAPYDVQVVTTEPSGTDYIEAMVAGSPNEIGQGGGTLGYSPMATDCSPQKNWISFAFANIHGTDPVVELCATVAHETGHVYGLDHTITCKDPMSYTMGCGQKHFLNLAMECGEENPRACQCTGDSQNTHRTLLDADGDGVTPPPPEVSIPYPTAETEVIDGFTVFGEVVEDRIVDRVEFRLNGFPWEITPGNDNVTTYSYGTSDTVPDGVIDVEVRAYNDLQLEGIASVTVTKGVPCTSASTCLDGQSCDDGRCAWPAPTVELGDECERDADCISYRCESDGEVNLCSALCVVGDDGSCGDGFTCLEAGDHGACWPSDRIKTGGCCSTGGGGGAGSALLAVALLILGRGRRRAARRY